MVKDLRVYHLRRNGKGWLCWSEDNSQKIRFYGAGSRPDLAIRDWKEQLRRRNKLS